MYDIQTKLKSSLNNDKKQETPKTFKTQQETVSAIDFHKSNPSNIFQFAVHKGSQQSTDIGSSIIQKKPNLTGLPDSLKNGIESLSGYSMDDVKVHYNSSEPAHLQSLAYAQGRDIYVAPGQEKHLGHEAWHIVQQKQGRVAPTMQMDSININNDAVLEREADIMGAKAIQMKASADTVNLKYATPVSCAQRTTGDLRCEAVISYTNGKARAEGYNDYGDMDFILAAFSKYNLDDVFKNFDFLKMNQPGQCAEPHAVANALEIGDQDGSTIRSIWVSEAQFTSLFRKRITQIIEGKREIDAKDQRMFFSVLQSLLENLPDQSTEDDKLNKNDLLKIINENGETVNGLSDNKRKDLVSHINDSSKDFRYEKCPTCSKWIDGNGNVSLNNKPQNFQADDVEVLGKREPFLIHAKIQWCGKQFLNQYCKLDNISEQDRDVCLKDPQKFWDDRLQPELQKSLEKVKKFCKNMSEQKKILVDEFINRQINQIQQKWLTIINQQLINKNNSGNSN